MTLSLRPLAALLLAVAMAPMAVSPEAVAGPEVRATVLSIGDGDTIRVLQGQRQITIRLACIDAPEMAQAPYGAQSRAYLQTRLRIGTPVALLPQTVDRYGRTVAEVIGELNLNLAMVEDGQAFAYRQYLGQCNAKEYLDAEYRASRSRYGVWRTPGGITRPWDFRRLGVRVEAAVRSVQAWLLLGQPQLRWQASVTAASRSAALQRPRSYCARATPTSMAMVMGWPARACVERTDNRTFWLWSSSDCSLPSSFERHAHGSHRI